MEVHVTFDGRGDLSGQIYRQIRAAILDGRLRPGESLAPTRDAARRLDVSRNTVNVAYERLAAEGFVTGRIGAGTFVTAEIYPTVPAKRPLPSTAALAPRAVWDDFPLVDLFVEPEVDFRAGLPDARLFPYQTWRRLLSDELRPSAVRTGLPGEPAGHRGLREEIARHIGVSRGVHATGDDVVVTNGTQQAVDLIGRVLVEPGTRIAVEVPGYTPPRRLFKSLGADLCYLPVDAEGLVVDAIPTDVRIAYVTPSHQFPLGMAMSLQRRMALLDWAERTGGIVIEDDYDTEFRFTGRPIEPLHSLDRSGRVVYVGSFSKSLLPTLRLGFLIAPPSLRHALCAAKFVADWHTSVPMQAALAGFIASGGFARHVRRMRAIYQERHELVIRTLAEDFADVLEIIPSAAGLHLSAFARSDAIDVPDLTKRARAVSMEIEHVGMFANRMPVRPALIFGYGAATPETIVEGMVRLRALI